MAEQGHEVGVEKLRRRNNKIPSGQCENVGRVV